MNIILLSGGSGKRLWPLSNDIRSKQFLKIFKNSNGEYQSMVQRIYSQIQAVDPDADITIATSKQQVSALKNQLGDDICISVEPVRRDTFPAIVLACSYLYYEKKIPEDEIIIICPVDPYVDLEYFHALKRLEKYTKQNDINLSLIGIKPTYPSEKYGYIVPATSDEIALVNSFKEKPSKEVAKKYIDQGALWNSGVFAFSLKYILEKAHALIDFISYEDLLSKYSFLDKISFDYAIVEQEKNIQVLTYSGLWKDLGTWNTLTETMHNESIGNVVLDKSCYNSNVINELDVPIVCMGISNLVVAASAEGILVSEKEKSSYIKMIVDKFDTEARFAEKSWGNYKVIDVSENSITVKVLLYPGHGMNYHSHKNRNETWTVIKGTGMVTIDGKEIPVSPGSIINIPAFCKHKIYAITELQVIEVQVGENITKQDKVIEL